MADRYGNDMQFEKMLKSMEEGKGFCNPDDYKKNNDSSGQGKGVDTKQKVKKIPPGCTATECDKNNWEYWEKHHSMRYDGRSSVVMDFVYEEVEDSPKLVVKKRIAGESDHTENKKSSNDK